MEEFVGNVLKKLRRIYTIPENEEPYVVNGLRRLYEQGYDETNAYRMARNWEHVNPELSEESALRNMKRIREELISKNLIKDRK